ncbi:hypothetical protein BGW38_002485 [Lunasporangiospora selenospora]|uniref:Uncharacterized protein n=1 Tax=Lunasporangiospora selenospora TaxID=979761 RepID=A0A9P6FSP6_9FUNG|nr:hypothetical protein BGW38_002485 [Lunasporangiospora selenospora]
MTLQVSMIHTSAPHGENSKLVMDATTNKRDKEQPQERGHDRSPSTARGDDESVRSKTQRRATASEQQRPRWVGTWSSNTSSSSSSASSSSTQSTRPAPTRPALAAVTPASGRFDTTSSLLKRRSAPDIGQNLARRNSVARVEAIAPSVSSIKSSIGARRGSVQSVNIKRVSDRDSTLSKQKGQNTTTLRPRKINSPTHDLDRQSRSSASSRLSIRTDEGSPSEQGEHDVTVEEPETKRDGASTPRSRQITSAGIAERSPVLIRQLSQALPPERISLSIESPMLALDTETHASRRRPETFLTASACLDTTPVYSTLLSIAEEAEAIEARIADDASSTMHSSSASLHSGGTEVNSTGAGSESYDGSKFGRESSLAWQEAAKILQKDGKSGHRRVQSFVDILLLKGFREQEPKRHSPSASQCDAASIRSEILLHSQSESPEMTTVRSRDVSVSGIESFPRHSTSSSISIKTLRSWFLGANNTTAPSTDQPVPGIEKPDKRKKHESDPLMDQKYYLRVFGNRLDYCRCRIYYPILNPSLRLRGRVTA